MYLSFETRILGCIFICVSVCKDFSAVGLVISVLNM